MDPNGRRSLRQKNSSVGESNPTEEKENHYETLEPAEKSINWLKSHAGDNREENTSAPSQNMILGGSPPINTRFSPTVKLGPILAA